MNDQKTGIEVYHDGYRKQYRYFCRVCGRQLGDSAQSSFNTGTREEISNLLCKTCKKKIEKGEIQPPE
jgi:predicted SprT family Zn-dependent metalloprotease